MFIRQEDPRDTEAIHELTTRAFAPMQFSNGSEAAIVRGLRDDGDLTISLVADEAGDVVGHVAFSPVTIGGRHDGWFGLGPISVEPARQGQGIGRALIEAGLALLRERGAAGCALIGSPDLYRRFGFKSDGRLTYGQLEPRYVQWLVLAGQPPVGELRYAPAFPAGG